MRDVLLILFALAVLTSSCNKGCTDFSATNYDDTATSDDGSCEYLGCTDPEASNYWSRAKEDDGSCLHASDVYFFNKLDIQEGFQIEVYWEDEFVGGFFDPCNGGVSGCESGCPSIDILNLQPGTYSYEAFERPVGTTVGGDLVFSGTVSIGATQCRFIVIE